MTKTKLPEIGKAVTITFLSYLASHHGKNDIVRKLRNLPNDAIFVSDGCSKWPDKWIRGENLYPACFWHDVRYYLGGSSKNRLFADNELFRDITKLSNRRLASLMWLGVRFGGILPFWGPRITWGWKDEVSP